MSASKTSNFFTLLSDPVCEKCGCAFNQDKHYWALRQSKKRIPGPTVDNRRSYITNVEMTCNHCDRWWNIRVLWVERRPSDPRDSKIPPHDGLQVLSHESPKDVITRIVAAKRGVNLSPTSQPRTMTTTDAATAKRYIAEIRKMLI